MNEVVKRLIAAVALAEERADAAPGRTIELKVEADGIKVVASCRNPDARTDALEVGWLVSWRDLIDTIVSPFPQAITQCCRVLEQTLAEEKPS